MQAVDPRLCSGSRSPQAGRQHTRLPGQCSLVGVLERPRPALDKLFVFCVLCTLVFGLEYEGRVPAVASEPACGMHVPSEGCGVLGACYPHLPMHHRSCPREGRELSMSTWRRSTERPALASTEKSISTPSAAEPEAVAAPASSPLKSPAAQSLAQDRAAAAGEAAGPGEHADDSVAPVDGAGTARARARGAARAHAARVDSAHEVRHADLRAHVRVRCEDCADLPLHAGPPLRRHQQLQRTRTRGPLSARCTS
jgi:hypothetical protein